MGFPVETIDGEKFDIVEKKEEGLLIASDGTVLKPVVGANLKVEVVQAVQAVEEAVEEVIDVVEAAKDAVEELLDGDEDAEEAEAPEA